ncbi:MAG: tandem-95 repeat protein [DPANN group archaeon]|nr:tandem-95 repeat protein [DPANN group archaeon]
MFSKKISTLIIVMLLFNATIGYAAALDSVTAFGKATGGFLKKTGNALDKYAAEPLKDVGGAAIAASSSAKNNVVSKIVKSSAVGKITSSTKTIGKEIKNSITDTIKKPLPNIDTSSLSKLSPIGSTKAQSTITTAPNASKLYGPTKPTMGTPMAVIDAYLCGSADGGFVEGSKNISLTNGKTYRICVVYRDNNGLPILRMDAKLNASLFGEIKYLKNHDGIFEFEFTPNQIGTVSATFTLIGDTWPKPKAVQGTYTTDLVISEINKLYSPYIHAIKDITTKSGAGQTINLKDYVVDPDTSLDDLQFTVSSPRDLNVTLNNENKVLTIKILPRTTDGVRWVPLTVTDPEGNSGTRTIKVNIKNTVKADKWWGEFLGGSKNSIQNVGLCADPNAKDDDGRITVFDNQVYEVCLYFKEDDDWKKTLWQDGEYTDYQHGTLKMKKRTGSTFKFEWTPTAIETTQEFVDVTFKINYKTKGLIFKSPTFTKEYTQRFVIKHANRLAIEPFPIQLYAGSGANSISLDSLLPEQTRAQITAYPTGVLQWEVESDNENVDAKIENDALIITPRSGFSGPVTLNLTVKDGYGASVTSQLSYDVTSVNDAPEIAKKTIPLNGQKGSPLEVVIELDDKDSSSWTAGGNLFQQKSITDKVITLQYSPTDADVQAGRITDTITITDDNGASITVDVSIQIEDVQIDDITDDVPPVDEITPTGTQNLAPVFNSIADQTTDEDTPLMITLIATDAENDTIIFTAASVNNVVATIENNQLTITPTTNWHGVVPVQINASDGEQTTTQMIAVTIAPINDNPIIDITPSVIPTDIAHISTPIQLKLKITDIDGTITTVRGNRFIYQGTQDDIYTLQYYPMQQDQDRGNITDTITAIDNDGGTATLQVKFNVYQPPANQAPVINSISEAFSELDTITMYEDTPFSGTINATDADNDQLTYSGTGSINLQVSVNTDGAYTITPAQDFNGTESITLQASDGTLTTEQSVTVTVNPVNDAPTIQTIPDQTTTEDNALIIPITINDVDNAATELAVVTNSTFEISASTTQIELLYTEGVLSDSVLVTVTDGINVSSTTFSVIVTPVNDAPVINLAGSTIPLTGQQGQTIELRIKATDVDSTTLTPKQIGKFVYKPEIIDTDGRFVFHHYISQADDALGTLTDTITIEDNNGGAVSETISIPLTGVNFAPVLTPIGNQETDEDTPLTLTLTATDADDDELTFSATSSANLAAEITGSTATVTPAQNFNGAENITISVTDNTITINQTVLVTVKPVNDAPTVSSIQAITFPEDTTYTALNLDDFVTDIESPDAQITWTNSGEANITIIIDPAGHNVSLTPNANFNGIETITFTATDQGGESDSTTVTVTITPVNDAPVISNIIGETNVNEDTTYYYEIIATDEDNTTTELTYTSNDTRFTENTKGNFTFTPTQQDTGGPINVKFTVTDGSLQAEQTLTLTANNINDAPTIQTIPDQTATEDNPLIIPITINDADNATTELTITTNSQYEQNTNTTHIELLYPNGVTSDTITVTVSDGQLNNTTTFQITINPINDAPTIQTIPTQLATENETLTIPITINDVDNAATELTVTTDSTYTQSVNTTHITLLYDNTFTATYEEITVMVSDGTDSATTSFIVNVGAVNDAPIIRNIIGPATIYEYQEYNYTVNVTDPDNPSNDLNYSAEYILTETYEYADGTVESYALWPTYALDEVPGQKGMFTLEYWMALPTSSVYVPESVLGINAMVNLTSQIVFTVTDGEFTITYPFDLATNDVPELPWAVSTAELSNSTVTFQTSIDSIIDIQEDEAYTIMLTVQDPDIPNSVNFTLNDSRFTLVNEVYLLGFSNFIPQNTKTYSFTFTQSGTQNVLMNVTDTQGNSVEYTIVFNVLGINDAPVITNVLGNTTFDVGFLSAFQVIATDEENNALTYSATSVPGIAITQASSSNNTIMLNASPSLAGQQANVTFSVSDGTNTTNTMVTMTMTQRDTTPVITSQSLTSAGQDTAVNYQVTATDENYFETLTYAVNDSRLSINPSTGTISWTPNAQDVLDSPISILFSITDEQSHTVSQVSTVTVYDVDLPPEIYDAPLVNASNGVTWAYQANATEPNNQQITYTVNDTEFAVNASGYITWSPQLIPPAILNRTILITATSGSGQQAQSATKTLVIPITPTIVNELALSNVTATPTNIITGDSIAINGRIANMGNTMQNVLYTIRITDNGTVTENNYTLSNVDLQETRSIAYTYTTTTEGSIKIEILVPLLSNEVNTTNNDATKYVTVTSPAETVFLNGLTFTLTQGVVTQVNQGSEFYIDLTVSNTDTVDQNIAWINITSPTGLTLNTSGGLGTQTSNSATNVNVQADSNTHIYWRIETPQAGNYDIPIQGEKGSTITVPILVV